MKISQLRASIFYIFASIQSVGCNKFLILMVLFPYSCCSKPYLLLSSMLAGAFALIFYAESVDWIGWLPTYRYSLALYFISQSSIRYYFYHHNILTMFIYLAIYANCIVQSIFTVLLKVHTNIGVQIYYSRPDWVNESIWLCCIAEFMFPGCSEEF